MDSTNYVGAWRVDALLGADILDLLVEEEAPTPVANAHELRIAEGLSGTWLVELEGTTGEIAYHTVTPTLVGGRVIVAHHEAGGWGQLIVADLAAANQKLELRAIDASILARDIVSGSITGTVFALDDDDQSVVRVEVGSAGALRSYLEGLGASLTMSGTPMATLSRSGRSTVQGATGSVEAVASGESSDRIWAAVAGIAALLLVMTVARMKTNRG